MKELTGSQRKYLRSIAHHLDALIIVGKQGISDSMIHAVDADLNAHELIKVKFNEFKEEKETLVREIETKTNSNLIGMVGHVAMFYRQHADPEKRTICFPENDIKKKGKAS
jgi:RNA-binding protein